MARRRIQIANIADFTGGLNLRADAFQLAKNESPDLMNVDVDPRGGFALRKVAAPFGDALAGRVHSLFSYETTTAAKQVIAGVGTSLFYGVGTTWTAVGVTQNGARNHAITFKDLAYIQDGSSAPIRWNGTTPVRLGQAYNNTDTPTNGNMPIGKLMAVWMGCVWVANTVESGVARPNRLRFSHPNFPEDWKDFQFIDVDTGSDGDYITALVPFGDRLLIFKKKSNHAVYGTSPDTFSVLPVSQEVGTISQESVVQTDVGLFFFSWPEGVFVYRGRQPEWVFERLLPAITSGAIQDGDQDEITLGWSGRRLWVSVPYSSVTPNRCYVLDPTLGKLGAWVQYDLAVGPFLEWRPPAAATEFLAAHAAGTRVLKLDQDGVADDFGAGAVHVSSYYRTRWFDLAQPAVRKRWRRPEVVVRSGAESELRVDVFLDYDASDAKRHFSIDTTADEDELMWDSDTSSWDTHGWGRSGVGNEVVRGTPIGTGRSVSLQFNGPSTNVTWGVDSIALKFTPKPVRS